jgi:mRNA interferase MazF
VIVQDDRFDATNSVTICAFTSETADDPLLRVHIAPDQRNGLHVPSDVMVDKITTVQKSKLSRQIGRLTEEDMIRLNRAMMVFLGLASTRRS